MLDGLNKGRPKIALGKKAGIAYEEDQEAELEAAKVTMVEPEFASTNEEAKIEETEDVNTVASVSEQF